MGGQGIHRRVSSALERGRSFIDQGISPLPWTGSLLVPSGL